MKNKKKIILNITGIIGIILSLILFIFILKINLLPTLYTLLIGGLLLIINIVSMLFLNLKKLVFNIIGIVLVLLLSIGSIIGTYYVSKTDLFLNKIFNKSNYSTTTYYVVTKAGNDYSKENIKDDIYYYNNIKIDVVKKYLKDTFELNYIETDSLTSLFDDIKSGNKNLMLIDKSTYSIVFEIDKNYKNSDYKIVYEFDITKKIDNKDKNTGNKFNLLIVGTDFANLNDLNLLVTVNLDTEKVLITTIPRAYYIPVAGDGRKDTLSFMAPYGIDTTVKSIEDYFNINIDYYLKINTHSLVKLVDEIGGITYCSDQAFYTTHSLVLDTYIDNKGKFYVSKGCQELNGIQTLTVARERLAFYDGDRTRQKNVVKIMQAILDKMISTDTLKNYEGILNSMSDLYETDMPKEEISLLAKKAISTKGNITLDMQSVDGYETRNLVHLTDMTDYVIVPFDNTVVDAVTNINKILDLKK